MMMWLGMLFVGLCAGAVGMAVLCDKVNEKEMQRLEQQVAQDSLNYLLAVQEMQNEIDGLQSECRLKQQVCNSLNDTVQRLRKQIKELKEKCNDAG